MGARLVPNAAGPRHVYYNATAINFDFVGLNVTGHGSIGRAHSGTLLAGIHPAKNATYGRYCACLQRDPVRDISLHRAVELDNILCNDIALGISRLVATFRKTRPVHPRGHAGITVAGNDLGGLRCSTNASSMSFFQTRLAKIEGACLHVIEERVVSKTHKST